jgi:hypothetical protein
MVGKRSDGSCRSMLGIPGAPAQTRSTAAISTADVALEGSARFAWRESIPCIQASAQMKRSAARSAKELMGN